MTHLGGREIIFSKHEVPGKKPGHFSSLFIYYIIQLFPALKQSRIIWQVWAASCYVIHRDLFLYV